MDSPITADDKSGFLTTFLFVWSPKLLSDIFKHWKINGACVNFLNFHIWRSQKANLINMKLRVTSVLYWHWQIVVRSVIANCNRYLYWPHPSVTIMLSNLIYHNIWLVPVFLPFLINTIQNYFNSHIEFSYRFLLSK